LVYSCRHFCVGTIGRAFFSGHNDNFDYLKQASLQAQFLFLGSMKLKFRNLVFTIFTFVSLFSFKKKTPSTWELFFYTIVFWIVFYFFFIYFIIEKKNSCINIHTLRDFCWVLPSSAIRLESSSKADSSLHEDTPDGVWLRIFFFFSLYFSEEKKISQPKFLEKLRNKKYFYQI